MQVAFWVQLLRLSLKILDYSLAIGKLWGHGSLPTNKSHKAQTFC